MSNGRLEKLEEELNRQRLERETLEKKALELKTDIDSYGNERVKAAAEIQNFEAEIFSLEERLPALREEERDKTQRLKQRRKQTAHVLLALQRLARFPPESLILRNTNPDNMVRSAILLRSAVPMIESQAELLRRDVLAVSLARREMSSQRSALSAAIQGLKSERRQLKALMRQKARMRNETVAAGRLAQARAAEIAREARDLRDLMARLETERKLRQRKREDAREAATVQARRDAERQAQAKVQAQAKTQAKIKAKPQTRGRRETESKNKAGPRITVRARPAAHLLGGGAGKSIRLARGKLPFPAIGRIVGRYGQPLDTGLTRKGISIETRANAQVVAPYDGEIVFSGVFRGYGQLLIIEHSEGYHSLLAGMDIIDGVIGQIVLAGEPVGIMGSPDRGKPALYVEIRRNGQPINPLPWLAARKGKVNG
jgi:septal ring factor EnvC (AmiA/AmiB activator)